MPRKNHSRDTEQYIQELFVYVVMTTPGARSVGLGWLRLALAPHIILAVGSECARSHG